MSEKGDEIRKPFTARAQALDCLCSLVFFTLLAALTAVVPAVTRALALLQPDPPLFRIDSSSLSILNASSVTSAVANWNVTFSTDNPNAKGFSFDGIQVSSIFNGKESLSNVTLPRFWQGREETEHVVLFRNMSVLYCSSDRNNNNNNTNSCGGGGAVNLSMVVEARAEYGGWTWPIKKDSIKVVCEDAVKIEFPFSSKGPVMFGSSECAANGRWKKLKNKCNGIFWNYLYVAVMIVIVLALSV